MHRMGVGVDHRGTLSKEVLSRFWRVVGNLGEFSLSSIVTGDSKLEEMSTARVCEKGLRAGAPGVYPRG